MQLDQNGLYDIYSITYVPFWQQKWFVQALYASAFGFMVLFVVIGLYFFIRWYKKRSEPIIVQVIKEISKLLHNAHNASDTECILIYAQSVHALKRYYFHNRGQLWLSATEDELILYLADWQADATWRHILKDFLQHSSNAKYAQVVPPRDIVVQDIQSILAYLNTYASQQNKQ